MTEKNEIYTNAIGKDLIDDAADRYSDSEFRGAMRFNVEKYMRRLGKKDDVTKELGKIIDYATRWLEFEEGLNKLDAMDLAVDSSAIWPESEKQLEMEK